MKHLISKIFLLFVFFLLPFAGFAVSEGFPAKEVFVQIFNFSVFAAVLILLVRKPLQVFFHKRQEEFFSFEKQAVQLEKEKQEEYKNWEMKIQALKEQEEGIQKKAQEEGDRFITQKKEEIKQLQDRLKREARFFIRLETEKLKRKLLKNWKGKVKEGACFELEKQAGSKDFQTARLEDFFNQVESHI